MTAVADGTVRPPTPASVVRQAAEHCRTDMGADDRALTEALAKWLDICADYMERWPGDAQVNSPFKSGGYDVACAVLGVTP